MVQNSFKLCFEKLSKKKKSVERVKVYFMTQNVFSLGKFFIQVREKCILLRLDEVSYEY